MSSISVQNFSSIDDDYKEISLSKELTSKLRLKLQMLGSLSIQIQMT
jgi:hypothetical protein